MLRGALESSTDADNAYLRDIRLDDASARSACHAESGDAAVGANMLLTTDGSCWQHVHPETYDVYDFTEWTRTHPGNSPTYNPIAAVAEAAARAGGGAHVLHFPTSHTRTRWINFRNRYRGVRLGRLGDTVAFDDLPSSVQTSAFAEAMGELLDDESTHENVEVCGSPGEVGNNPELGHRYPITMNAYGTYDLSGQGEVRPRRSEHNPRRDA